MTSINAAISLEGAMSTRTVRTTVTLPADLIDAADRAVRNGHARSRNELLVTALRHELAARERADIDAAYAALRGDHELQAESVALAEEAMSAGWEALGLGESEG
jgi:metal-responsive CopG/Arc/MetJ family transcriptional regulator